MLQATLDEHALRDTIASCHDAAAASHASLRHCANLAPAGTGTKSLAALLKLGRSFSPTVLYRYTIAPNRTNAVVGSQAARDSVWDSPQSLIMPYRLVTHKHFRRLHGFAPLWKQEDWARARALKKLPRHDNSTLLARCFVMTVRDPASRLASAFRASFASRHKINTYWGGQHTPKAWIAAVRAREPRVMAILNRSFASPSYRFEQGGDCCDDVDGGNNFLTSQVDYIWGAAAACSRGIPVHFVCTETLDDDFALLMAATNSTQQPSGSMAPLSGTDASAAAPVISRSGATLSPPTSPSLQTSPSPHARPHQMNARSARFDSGSKAGYHELYMNNSQISQADSEYVRRALYRLDSLLHTIVCRKSRAARPRPHT